MSSDLSSNLETLLGKMENFITTKSVVGEPMHIGDVIIIPLVDVVFGVGAGASSAEGTGDQKNKDGGGGGLGAKISPSAVLVIINGQAQLINAKNQDSISKLIDMAPGIVSKLNLSSMFGKKKEDEVVEDMA